MKTSHSLFAAKLAAFLYGLTALAAGMPASHAAPKSHEQAICAVCGPREGSGAEPVRARATYKTKTYAFCAVECKVAFLQEPQEFLVTDEGKPAPGFTLKTLQGQNVSLSDFKGQVVLADFWGTFCLPCVEALPYLESLRRKYGAQGFVMVGIAVDESKKTVQTVAKQAKVGYPMLLATPKVWSAYKVNTLPSMVLIGRDGRIIKRYGGEADKKAMEAEIVRALAVTLPKPISNEGKP